MNKLAVPTVSPARFVYTTNLQNGRRATVAYIYDDANKCIRLHVAECSAKDQFVKKIGRDVAFGRLVANGGYAVPYSVMGGSSYTDVAKFIFANVDSVAAENLGLY